MNKNEFLEVKTSTIIKILKEISNYSNLNPYICSEQVDSNSFLNSLLKYIPIIENRDISENKFIEDKLNIISKELKDIKDNLDKNEKILSEQKPIPIKWFLDSLIQSLQRLPDEYTENDYKLLLQELENDINNSIIRFDFDFLSKILENLDEIKKNKYHYKIVKNTIIDIDLNIQTNKIIENEQIIVNLIFKDKKLKIEAGSQELIFYPLSFFYKKEEGKTIKSFVNNFPNINEYQLKPDEDIITLIKEMDIPQELEGYFKLIKDLLKEKNINNYSDIYNKIYDYIMECLNDKLFPKEPSKKDIKIKKNCMDIIWVEPSNLIKTNENFVTDIFLPDAIYYFQKLNEEKSPRKKFIYLKEIFNCINNLGLFNGKKFEGVDDEMPILNYLFIKAKPDNIYNNCRYMELFLGEKEKEIEGQKLTELKGICETLEDFSYKKLYNITESDYEYNCDLVKQGILY